MKHFFISSKKFFSFSRYSHFCIPLFPFFLPVSHCFRGCSKINLNVYDVINCLNKNLITHFVCYLEKKRDDIETSTIDRVLNKDHFYGKIMQKMCIKSQSQIPFQFWLITQNNQCKQEIIFKKRYFERGLLKSPKKANFIFSFEPSPKFSKTKGAWNQCPVALHVTK